MEHRADIWRKYLIGNTSDIHDKRKIYHNIITIFPYSIPDKIDTLIARDMPRTTFKGNNFLKVDTTKKIIESLLHQYIQVMPCDGYMQGFAYIMAVLYHVYSKHDIEHALSDTFWSFAAIISIIRPTIPDHDPDDFAKYTKKWSKYYIKHIKIHSSRTHTWLSPFYDVIAPTLSVKWLMIWFSQQFDMKNLLIIWDALVTCNPTQRTKLLAIIAANITIQHSNSIELWSSECPTEIGPRIMSVVAKDATIIIEASRNAMLQYTLPI